MTDIVERLRIPVMFHGSAEETNAERREAADEIERIRCERDHHPVDQLQLYQEEIALLREDSARVIYALDCALQLVECLIAYAPEGVPLPNAIVTCKYRLDEAMKQIRRTT